MTLKNPVPDSCLTCGRRPPVVIAPDERTPLQMHLDVKRRRAFVIVALLPCAAGAAALVVFQLALNGG